MGSGERMLGGVVAFGVGTLLLVGGYQTQENQQIYVAEQAGNRLDPSVGKTIGGMVGDSFQLAKGVAVDVNAVAIRREGRTPTGVPSENLVSGLEFASGLTGMLFGGYGVVSGFKRRRQELRRA